MCRETESLFPSLFSSFFCVSAQQLWTSEAYKAYEDKNKTSAASSRITLMFGLAQAVAFFIGSFTFLVYCFAA